jgi:hypothetical protein
MSEKLREVIKMIIYVPKEIDTENIKYTNGANRQTAELIIEKISKDGLGFRELDILENLTEIEKNNHVPTDYTIYKFFNEFGDGFEAGKTPRGYSVTC